MADRVQTEDGRYRAWLARVHREPELPDGLTVAALVAGVGGLAYAGWRLAHGGPHGPFWIGVVVAARGLPAGWLLWQDSRSGRAA